MHIDEAMEWLLVYGCISNLGTSTEFVCDSDCICIGHDQCFVCVPEKNKATLLVPNNIKYVVIVC